VIGATFAGLALVLQAQGASASPGSPSVPATGVPMGPVELITQGSLASKLVLVFLLLLSLVSWGVMLLKWAEYRRVERAGHDFMREFEHTPNLQHAESIAKRSAPSPFVDVFARAMQFLTETRASVAPSAEQSGRLSGSQVEALRLILDSETSQERDRLARLVPWLATIGSVSPLIGLLGTVLGVISAFTGIAARGSGNLSAVAPGVAEALVATAAALAVAIPAVFGYNVLANRLNRVDSALESFGSELIALLVREGRI
jgi:biopolymer transport protein TolQ